LIIIQVILSNYTKDIFKKNKKIKPEWLSINAPELNDVYRIFSLIQREVLNNRHFTSIKEVKLAINKWIRKFNSNEIAISLQN
jgi:transposase